MLNFLQIRDFTIVKSLDLEFSPGFTCITGETGAGKSILVDALGLLSGRRADTSLIRAGVSRAELCAGFELNEGSPAHGWLLESDLDDGNRCLLRRVISDSGRSRAWINGTPVTLQQLAELGARLVEIHGQNEHVRLVNREEQFRLLDDAAELQAPLVRLQRAYEEWRTLDQERNSLLEETQLDAGELELLDHQIRELRSSALPPEDFQQLVQEHHRLARGGELVDALERALATLEADESGATALLHAAVRSLEPHQGLDSSITSALGLLREASINCEEARNALQSALSQLDLSPERLDHLERQLSAQHDLARKHRVDAEALLEVLTRLEVRRERAASADQRLRELEEALESALVRYRDAARALHAARTSRARALSGAVTELMQQLGMEGGVFEIELNHDPRRQPAKNGSDDIQLRVSANPGIPAGPLRKVASGGELSRISLAIKVASKSEDAHTQIFDEVDAGIGGETANAVGALLQSLAAGAQALCVTHLAQVAAHADQQVQVYKDAERKEPSVATNTLAANERIDEIARMLGGRVSEQSRAHASELLATASTRH